METLTIKLGDREFVIKTLTFKQLRNFTPAFIKFGGKLSTPEAFDELANAILACTSREYPEVARSVLDDMPITPIQLLDAADALAGFSGLFKKAPTSGEATGEATKLTGE